MKEPKHGHCQCHLDAYNKLDIPTIHSSNVASYQSPQLPFSSISRDTCVNMLLCSTAGGRTSRQNKTKNNVLMSTRLNTLCRSPPLTALSHLYLCFLLCFFLPFSSLLKVVSNLLVCVVFYAVFPV